MRTLPDGAEPFDPQCRRCPRLLAFCTGVAEQHPGYHCAPVPAWGRSDARLLVVGMAPGLHGANRTGRPFTGDASGSALFLALHAAGFSSSAAADGARLRGVRITNAVKCLPPENLPTPAEANNCRPYLVQELDTLWRSGRRRGPVVLLTLGGVAHRATLAALRLVPGIDPANTRPSSAAFAHGAEHHPAPGLHLLATYHPSRYNMNTRRLTQDQLDSVLARARRIIG